MVIALCGHGNSTEASPPVYFLIASRPASMQERVRITDASAVTQYVGEANCGHR